MDQGSLLKPKMDILNDFEILTTWANSIGVDSCDNKDFFELTNWSKSRVASPELFKHKYESTYYYYIVGGITLFVLVFILLFYFAYGNKVITVIDDDDIEVIENDDDNTEEIEMEE